MPDDRDLSDPKNQANEKDATIHVRLDRGTKQYWEYYVSDEINAVNSISELVRLSVAKETSGKYEKNEEEMNEIIDELSTIQDQNRRLTQTLDTLSEENIQSHEMEDLIELVLNRYDEDIEEIDE